MVELLKIIGFSLLAGVTIGVVGSSLDILARIVSKHLSVFLCVLLLLIAIVSRGIQSFLSVLLVLIMLAISVAVAICGMMIALLVVDWIYEKCLNIRARLRRKA